MKVFLVGPCATGKTTILNEFVGLCTGRQIIIVDDCKKETYEFLENSPLSRGCDFVLAFQDREYVSRIYSSGDIIMETSCENGKYTKTLVHNNQTRINYEAPTVVEYCKPFLARKFK